MELLDAKCPNCGAELKINRDEKTGFCNHCKSSFLIDDAVKNYVTNNSYKIEHATIVNNESNMKLFNEVDRYMAFFNLGDYDKLEDVVEYLKDKFPHKGIARIVILHYELVFFINKITYEVFEKEANEIGERSKNYEPKSYKNPPPLSEFYDKLGRVELKYSEDLDDVLTKEEKEKYPDLISKTKNYLDMYYKICLANDEMNEKFSPFADKYNKRRARREKFKSKLRNKPILKFGFIAIVALVMVAVISFIVVGFSYLFVKKRYETVDDVNALVGPYMEEASIPSITMNVSGKDVTYTFVKRYTIYGRVAGKKNFLGFNSETKVMSTTLFLTWGELSPKEKADQISWSCNMKGSWSYSWDWTLGNKTLIYSNSSNNKIIPFSSYVKKAIKKVKKSDVIKLEGYLVNVRIKEKNKVTRYYTSTDVTGNDSQIIYVTDIAWIK